MNATVNGTRVALVTPIVGRGDGQGRVNLETVLHALERGMHVVVLAHRLDEELQRHPHVRWIRSRTSKVPTALLQAKTFDLECRRWLAAHRSEYDVLHVNGSATIFPCDVNSVHFVHGAWGRSPAHTSNVTRGAYALYHRALTTWAARQERLAFAVSRRIVAVSEQVMRELVSVGVPRERIEVIVNGVDTNEFHPGDASRAAYALPEKGFIGLFAGDMSTPRKNLDTVLRAMLELPDVHLAVVGSLAKMTYPARVKAMGLDRRVHFLGWRRDVGDIMRACDAFVFPSRYEACSLVMLEALSSGLPVLTSKTAGGWEIVTGDCGFVSEEPDDYATLRDNLRRLVDDAELLRRFSHNARAQAERYSWRAMAERYVDLYEHAARSAAASSS